MPLATAVFFGVRWKIIIPVNSSVFFTASISEGHLIIKLKHVISKHEPPFNFSVWERLSIGLLNLCKSYKLKLM